jgi:hypothetical protein
MSGRSTRSSPFCESPPARARRLFGCARRAITLPVASGPRNPDVRRVPARVWCQTY